MHVLGTASNASAMTFDGVLTLSVPALAPKDSPRTGQDAMEARALAHVDLDLPFFGHCQLQQHALRRRQCKAKAGRG